MCPEISSTYCIYLFNHGLASMVIMVDCQRETESQQQGNQAKQRTLDGAKLGFYRITGGHLFFTPKPVAPLYGEQY